MSFYLQTHRQADDDMDVGNTLDDVSPVQIRGRGRGRGRARAASSTSTRARGRGRGASKEAQFDIEDVTIVSDSEEEFIPPSNVTTPRQTARVSRGMQPSNVTRPIQTARRVSQTSVVTTPRQTAKYGGMRGMRGSTVANPATASSDISQAFARQSQISTQPTQSAAPPSHAATEKPVATVRSARPKASSARGVCYVSDSD